MKADPFKAFDDAIRGMEVLELGEWIDHMERNGAAWHTILGYVQTWATHRDIARKKALKLIGRKESEE